MPRVKKPRSAATAFVPRTVLQLAFAGVIPAVAGGCASATTNEAGVDVSPRPDYQVIVLAMIGFDAEAGTDAVDRAQPPPDQQIIVLAMIGFDAEAGSDATEAGRFGVADVGFGGG